MVELVMFSCGMFFGTLITRYIMRKVYANALHYYEWNETLRRMLEQRNRRIEYMDRLFMIACDQIEDPETKMIVMSSRRLECADD